MAGFANSGYPSASARAPTAPPGPRAHSGSRTAPYGTDRQSRRREQTLLHVLVHPHGRAEHPRAHVGHARELEQTLHRAVLAVRTVQHGEHDVDRRRAEPSARDEVRDPALGRELRPPRRSRR